MNIFIHYMNLKKIKINENLYNLYFKKNVFKPTATTSFLLKALIDKNKKINKKKILDLGCGSGIVSVVINSKYNNNFFYASDLDKDSFDTTIKNFKKFKIRGSVKKGNLLEPWFDKKFDYIINDISGISSTIAKKSTWFRNIPSNTGVDGTKLTITIIKELSKHLSKNGKAYLPIISLSNTKKVLNVAKKYFKKIKVISNDKWFLPADLEKYKTILLKLKKNKQIDFDYKFGKYICYTKIIELKN